MLHSGPFKLPPRKKHNRKRAALRLEFGMLFLCTLGLAYLSYWLFAEYREERVMEWASKSITRSPEMTELELSSQSPSSEKTKILTQDQTLSNTPGASETSLEAVHQPLGMPVILYDGEVHIGTNGIFTTTNLPDEWYEQRVFRPLSSSVPRSLPDEDTASLKLQDESPPQSRQIEQSSRSLALERIHPPITAPGSELYDFQTAEPSSRTNSVIEYDSRALSNRKPVIGSDSATNYGGKSVVEPYPSDFNSAPGGKAPVGIGKSPIEEDDEILKNVFRNPEELSEPVFTIKSESHNSFSAAPSQPVFPTPIPSAGASSTYLTSDSSSISIFKDPNYDEELLNQFRHPNSGPEIPVAQPITERRDPFSIGNISSKTGQTPAGSAGIPALLPNATAIGSGTVSGPHPGIRPVTPIDGNTVVNSGNPGLSSSSTGSPASTSGGGIPSTPGNSTTGTPNPGVNPPGSTNGISNPTTPGNPTTGTTPGRIPSTPIPGGGTTIPSLPPEVIAGGAGAVVVGGIPSIIPRKPGTTVPSTPDPPASNGDQIPPLNPTTPVTGIGGGTTTPVIPLPPATGGAAGAGGIIPLPVIPPTTPVTPSIGGGSGGGTTLPPTPPTIPITPIPPLTGGGDTTPPAPPLPPVSTVGGTTPPNGDGDDSGGTTPPPPSLPPVIGGGGIPPYNPGGTGTTLPPATPPVTSIGGGITTPVIPLPPVAGGGGAVGGIVPLPVIPPIIPIIPSIGGGGDDDGGSTPPPTPPTIPITPIPPRTGGGGTTPPTPPLPPVSTIGGTTPPNGDGDDSGGTTPPTSLPPVTGGGGIPPYNPGGTGTTLPTTTPPTPVTDGGSRTIIPPIIPLPPITGGGGGSTLPPAPPSVPITPIPPLTGDGGTTLPPPPTSLPPVTGGGGIPPYNPGGTIPPVTPIPPGGDGGNPTAPPTTSLPPVTSGGGGGGGGIPLIPVPPIVPIGGGAGGGGTVTPVVPPVTIPTTLPPSTNPPVDPGGPSQPEKDPRLKTLICTPWVVQSGQTIESLAQSTGASPNDIREINGITSIRPGQTIRLPIRFPIPCCE